MRPYLRAANVTWSGLSLADVREMDFTESESETYELRPGDLLLSEASGSPGEVGKPAQYQGEIEGCCFQNTLIRVRLPEGLHPDFYEYFFREQALNGRFAAGSRGVGIRHLGASGLADWRVPIPPLAEQQRIVGVIEEAFSKLDAGEAGLRNVRLLLKRMRDAVLLVVSSALRRSVLRAAFEGQLVPQDPTDEPASVLLERIRAERAAAPTAKKPRRPRRAASP
jgi:type I restriction enzyme S subunit